MSFSHQSESHELLVELSETEQETVVGGFNTDGLFFLQITAIDSFTENLTNISANGGNTSASSFSKTGHSFRQITLAFTSSLASQDNSENSPLLMIFRLFSS
ncbi:MAG: hypothetical protein IGS23_19115 [Rivularia sp. T60_A2020_040]|nr:hypothetical protein [Rivularia sp. T60_A2020_040]